MAADYCFGSFEQLRKARYFGLVFRRMEVSLNPSSLRMLNPRGDNMKEYLLKDNCRVQALEIWCTMVDWEDDSLLSNLAHPACGLTHLSLEGMFPSGYAASLSKSLVTSLQMSSLRYLRIDLTFIGEDDCKLIAEALANGACPLLGLALVVEHVEYARHLGTALVRPECKLRCLGIEFLHDPPTGGWFWVDQLLRNPACKLLDLRLEVARYLPHLQDLDCGLERLSLCSSSPNPRGELPGFCHKLKEISVFLFNSVADLEIALERPDCKLEALTFDYLRFDEHVEVVTMRLLSKALLEARCTIKCLTFYDRKSLRPDSMIRHISHALRSKDCKLESLYFFSDTELSAVIAKMLVDALETNFKLCSLKANLPSSVRARVSNLLRRNQLLKEGGLLEQPHVKPTSARLFLCGHERVGKTTIRKQIKRKGKISLHKLKSETPTRGMELQALTFGNKKLVLCDLAGHKEYHAFHHFFLTGSDRDLFLVVCKATNRPDQREFSFKLRYWFRFIASHRTPGKPLPKVIVVLNFFSPALSEDVMTSIASECTRTLMQEYADVLDFGRQTDINVFGINAMELRHFSPILRRLKDLLTELLDSRSLIPKICDDISSIISTSRANMISLWKPKPLLSPLWQIVSRYAAKFCKDNTETYGGAPFRAALVELHNAGQIVFFLSNEEQDDEHQIIILDCQWFCCKLIGILMQPEEMVDYGQRNLPEPGVWLREDIANILLQQNCQPEYIPKVLHYLQRLELVYPFQDDAMDRSLPPSKLMFPSLLPETQRSLQWQECEDKVAIFGRRLECEDKDKTLLPAGAFARLQVKLHNVYGNMSWKVGCGWISFVENCVATIVSFGGETRRWEDRHWIDIMVRYPEPREQHENTAENIVLFVKKQIFSICQGIDRGFPAVSLRECVMSEGLVMALEFVSADIVPLDTIKEKVRKEGILYQLSWSDNRSTPISDLFLPGELRELVYQDFKALTEIAQEFHETGNPPPSCDALESFETSTDAGLNEDDWLLLQVLHTRLDRQDKMLKDIFEGVSSIQTKMGALLRELRDKKVNIFRSCSYQLVKDVLAGPLPLFPFLTDRKGLWQPIKNLVGKEVDLHFMCEWYAGAHDVEGQKGLPVKISRPEWLVRAGPVLVPALKVACCAARVAATVVLPGSQIFVPSFESLGGFGLNDEKLKYTVLPETLKCFVDEVPDLQELTSCQPPVDKFRLRNFLFDLMKGKNVDMERHFQLFRVEMPQNKRIAWVCRDHSEGLERLKNQDPFQ